MQFITNFGDAAVLVPLAAATLLWLSRIVGRRSALMWCGAWLVAGGATALLKVYLSACGTPFGTLDSPSGHTSMSTFVYGGLAVIAGTETESWTRIAAAATGTALVAAVALSRVMLGAHSPVEVAVGLAIGGAALALFARTYLQQRGAERQIWPLLAGAALVALALYGHHARLEPLWRTLAAHLRDATGLCRA
jgi:membrane-associated phospholipid phosphatase